MLRQQLREVLKSRPEPTPFVLAHMLETVFRDAVYLSLHSADPGEDGENEIEGGNYERQVVNFMLVQDSSEARSEQFVQFSNMPSVTLTHLGLWDSEGNFLWPGEIVDGQNQPQSVRMFAGDRAEFSVGDLIAMFEN